METSKDNTNSVVENGKESVEGEAIQPNGNVNEENQNSNEEKQCSSSSSSSFGESFELVGTSDNDVFTFEVVAPEFAGQDANNIFATDTNSHNDNGSPTHSPTTQVMDRQYDPNRIPSSIFSRTKSSAQGEWSTASNESLFSIHMGNASFTREHSGWFGCSGELGLHADPTIDYSSNQPPSVQQQNIKSNEEPSKQNESKSSETIGEIIKENEVVEDASKQKLAPKISLHGTSFRCSDGSTASTKSFAFPILTGDHKGSQKQKPPSQPPSQPQSPKVTQSQSQNESQTTPAPMGFNLSKWFSCLFCCSSANKSQ